MLRWLARWLTKGSRERQQKICAALEEYGPMDSAVLLHLTGLSWSLYGELEQLQKIGKVERFFDAPPRIVETGQVRQIFLTRAKYRLLTGDADANR